MPFCFVLVLTIHITISVSMLLPFWSSMTPILFIPPSQPMRFATGGGSFAGGVSAQLGDAVYLCGTPWVEYYAAQCCFAPRTANTGRQ